MGDDSACRPLITSGLCVFINAAEGVNKISFSGDVRNNNSRIRLCLCTKTNKHKKPCSCHGSLWSRSTRHDFSLNLFFCTEEREVCFFYTNSSVRKFCFQRSDLFRLRVSCFSIVFMTFSLRLNRKVWMEVLCSLRPLTYTLDMEE